jgi:hypothetical protein
MTGPHEFSLEALVADAGQCVSAGLPIPLRPADDALRASEAAVEGSATGRAKLEAIMARIAEHEARLRELHDELRAAIRECLYPAPVRARGGFTSPAPAPTTATDRPRTESPSPR